MEVPGKHKQDLIEERREKKLAIVVRLHCTTVHG